ncbi:conserved Plasmodium protein, unknown function [Plasmodium ovale wallikeri]|uniref:DNA2/NAM7 helicase-like C-terminal domain-containing protein n=1 Tax=Plasmodium ovale wallikeri TaxID=864142 RepID=A0A1A8ZBE4_PLAOA|nr:conserved Plasmodium protein, unknown function [Plasmodium ovale wallikeri]
MNWYRRVMLSKGLANRFSWTKKRNYATKDVNRDIFENENCFNKLQEFACKKIIYKKDCKDYMKLHKVYKPSYSKLSVERENTFNFSICWMFRGKTVWVRNEQRGEKKKIKAFRSTLCSLKEELRKLQGEEVTREWGEEVDKRSSRSPSRGAKEAKENTTKINYAKLTKLWESFLHHKVKNNRKEEYIYREMVKKSFLRTPFFEVNKKRDFQFFENILTSLLLKPDIFINVLNLLYSIFFSSQLHGHNDNLQKRRVQERGNSCPVLSTTARRDKTSEGIYLYGEKNGRQENEDRPCEPVPLTRESLQKNSRRHERDGGDGGNEGDEGANWKMESTEGCINHCSDVTPGDAAFLTKWKIRRYFLNYLFNTYYEKYIGLENLQKTFDLHSTYKLKYCAREDDGLFRFTCLDEIEIEKKSIILIRCNNVHRTFLLGIVKKLQRIKDLYVLYVEIRKYNSRKCVSNSFKLYEEMDVCEEYFERYLNKDKGTTYEYNPIELTCESFPTTLYREQDNEINGCNLYEAVTLAVQINTICNRIKYCILNIFEKKKKKNFNGEIVQVLLNGHNERWKKQEIQKGQISCTLPIARDYNYLIEDAINKYIQNRKSEMYYLNLSDGDLLKRDKIMNKLYKILKNDPQEFSKMSGVYKKFDTYQKGVLCDIVLNDKHVPVHLVHGAPGSGKSDLIAFIIYMLTLEKKNSVFVGTSKHISVQNIRKKLLSLNLCLNRENTNRSTHQKSDIYIDTIYQAFKIKEKKIKHLIIDEASSLSEYNSLICLNLNCDFIYAFGDDKQLTFHSLINEKKRLEINYLSIFEKLKQHRNSKCHYLLIQYRLIFPMYLFTSFYFYNKKLIASKKVMNSFFHSDVNEYNFFHLLSRSNNSINSVCKFPDHVGIPILFIDTYHETLNRETFEQKVNHSYVNKFEAEIILKLTRILSISRKRNVAILTPYTSQKLHIQSILENSFCHSNLDEHKTGQKGENDNAHKNSVYQMAFKMPCNSLHVEKTFATKRRGPPTGSIGNDGCKTFFNLFRNGCTGKEENASYPYRLQGKKNCQPNGGKDSNCNELASSQGENFPCSNLEGVNVNPANGSFSEGKMNMHHMNLSRNSSVNVFNKSRFNSNRLSVLFSMTNTDDSSFYNLEDEENCNVLHKNVHTIDSYQGCENDIIIISTVRSNDKNSLGFLNDEKRMNVILTRMKKGIIIIGNSNTLKNNYFWNEFISFLDFFHSRKSIFTHPLFSSFRPV